MIYFLLVLLAFSLIVIYLAISLSSILRLRSKVEESQKNLEDAIERKYTAMVEKKECIENLRFAANREKPDISSASKIALGLCPSDEDEEIIRCIKAYNRAADHFNKRVFSLPLSPVARACHIDRLIEID